MLELAECSGALLAGRTRRTHILVRQKTYLTVLQLRVQVIASVGGEYVKVETFSLLRGQVIPS